MIRVVAALLLACALALPAAAADKPPLPHFMSLRSNEVNLRAGPGEQYPIQWVYRRKGLPVEIIDSYDVWRHVRDWQGTIGWIQVRLLSATRTVIIKADTRTIYQEPARDSPALAKLEPGVIANLLECRNAWCRVETRGRRVVRGWLLRSEIWGVTADEIVE
jgi:SH3-like domain-containing protein